MVLPVEFGIRYDISLYSILNAADNEVREHAFGTDGYSYPCFENEILSFFDRYYFNETEAKANC